METISGNNSCIMLMQVGGWFIYAGLIIMYLYIMFLGFEMGQPWNYIITSEVIIYQIK